MRNVHYAYLVEADDVGVLQQLHDLHLSEDLFQVLIVQLGFIHYFYSYLERKKTRVVRRNKDEWIETMKSEAAKRNGQIMKQSKKENQRDEETNTFILTREISFTSCEVFKKYWQYSNDWYLADNWITGNNFLKILL